MTRFLLFSLALWHGANGMFMVLAPQPWYTTVPGVPATGAFNAHFVTDIGIAFLASALALLLAAQVRGSGRASLMLAPALFLGGHALLHLAELSDADLSKTMRDLVAMVVPGLMPGAIALAASRQGAHR